MSERLRVGVVGAGWWAVSNHMPILAARDDVELAAVCRLGAAELRRVQERFAIPLATEDYVRMLDEGGLDAVIVASPHQLHADQAIMALERGLHVMVEKPIATDAASAHRLGRAAAASGRHGLVPYGWNFQPFAAEARRWIAEGGVGEIRHISAQMASPIGELMTGAPMPGTEDALFRPDPAMWSDPATGGYGWGQLVHLLGLLFHIAPLTPERVTGMTDAGDGRCDLYNAASVRCREGATMALSGAATLPAGDPFQVDIRLFGAEGALFLDIERDRLVLRRHDGAHRQFAMPGLAGAYHCEAPVHRFCELCLGRTDDNPASVALAVTGARVIDALHKAHATNAPVTIEELS